MRGVCLLTLVCLLLADHSSFAEKVELRLAQPSNPETRFFFSIPGSPVIRSVGSRVTIAVEPKARGPYTLIARAPGCLPVFRHFTRQQLLRLRDGLLTLNPIPFSEEMLPRLAGQRGKYSSPPKLEASERGFDEEEITVYSPDARGVAITRSYSVEDAFRGTGDYVNDVWWCPRLPGKPVLVGRCTYFISNLAVSPDGEWLAYSLGKGNHEDLLLYNLFTGERRTAAADPKQSECLPNWSLDGRYLVYTARPVSTQEDDGPGSSDEPVSVRLTRWDGKEKQIVAANVPEVCPSFSPIGTVLAYVGTKGVTLFDLKTGRHTTLPPGVWADSRDDQSLLWSPDGQWLTFVGVPVDHSVRDRSGPDDSFVYLAQPASNSMQRLTRAYAGLAWLPNNHLLVTRLMLWAESKGLHEGAVIVNTEGLLRKELPVPPSASKGEILWGSSPGGGMLRIADRSPWELPLLPTLFTPQVSTQPQGRVR